MPIKDKLIYPSNWKEIRKSILERDRHSCANCGIENYSVVKWDAELKKYERACGNIHIDAFGRGECTYEEARFLVRHWNEMCDDGKWIVIVLTIAHLNHDTSNNDDSNLSALCQRCHLKHDHSYHLKNARQTRNRKKGLTELF